MKIEDGGVVNFEEKNVGQYKKVKYKDASDPAKDQSLRLFSTEFFLHRSLSQYFGFPIKLLLTNYLIG